MNPRKIPSGEAIIKNVIHAAFCCSELAKVSAHTGMYMQMKTWKKPIMNLSIAIIMNSFKSVKTNRAPAFRDKVKTIIGFIQLDREKIPVATTDPTTMPP